MAIVDPYLYPSHRGPRIDEGTRRLVRMAAPSDSQALTGIVLGKRASDLEERTARALYKMNIDFLFQTEIPVTTSVLGKGKVIDFIVDIGISQPLEVDGPLGHATAAQQAADALRDSLLEPVLLGMGMRPIMRIKWDKLQTQVQADQNIREALFL